MLGEMIVKFFKLIEKKESRHWYNSRLTIVGDWWVDTAYRGYEWIRYGKGYDWLRKESNAAKGCKK